MATNLYESPLGSSPISRYVSLPFAEIGEALARKQKDYDTNQLKIDSHLQDALKIQSIQEHDPYRIKYVQKVNDSVGELMQKYPDMGSPEFNREFHRIAREHAGDPNLQVLSRSLENYKQQQKHTEALKKEGKYADYNDPYARGFEGLDEQGNPIEYRFNPYEASEDHAKPVYNLFDKMKPSGSDAGGFNVDPTTGDIISVKKGSEGIAQGWVDRIAGNNVEHFLTSTSEGKDFARMMSRKGGVKNTQELREVALQYMRKLGSAYVFNKSNQDSTFQHGPEHKQKTDQTETVSTDAVPLGNFDEFKVNIPNAYPVKESNSSPLGFAMDWDNVGKGQEEKIEITSQQLQIYDKAKKFLGQESGTKKGKAEIINRYLDVLGKSSLESSVEQYTNTKEVENQNRILFGKDEKGAAAISNRSMKLMQGEGDKQLTGKQFLEKYGDAEKYSINTTGKVTPDNPYFSAGKQITVSDKNGKVVAQFASEGSKEEQAQAHYAHNFYKAKYSPAGTSKIQLNDMKGNQSEYTIDYRINTGSTLSDDGIPQRESETARLLDKNGKVLKEVTSSNDAIGELYQSLSPKK